MKPGREWQLATHQLGRRVLVFDEVDSTSSRCAAFAENAAQAGLVVLAHAQTAGRGQHGRSWLCEPGMGVLLSVLLFPPSKLRRPAILTAWAAVSVGDLIEQAGGLSSAIKWPNDVLIQGRKVCGILIEQGRGIIAGIGLNLNQARQQFSAAGLAEAGSLALFTGQTYDVEAMARRLIVHLDQRYQQLLQGDLAALEMPWKERLGLLGSEVLVEGTTENRSGRLLDITFDAIALESDAGELTLLAPETIKHIYRR